MRHAALLAAALTLAPALAQAGELAYDQSFYPICPVQPGAVICENEQALAYPFSHERVGSPGFAKGKAKALASGKCHIVSKQTPTLAYHPTEWYGNSFKMKIKTADEPNKWQFVSTYFLFDEDKSFTNQNGMVCGLTRDTSESE